MCWLSTGSRQESLDVRSARGGRVVEGADQRLDGTQLPAGVGELHSAVDRVARHACAARRHPLSRSANEPSPKPGVTSHRLIRPSFILSAAATGVTRTPNISPSLIRYSFLHPQQGRSQEFDFFFVGVYVLTSHCNFKY